jgi:uncharacterized delta-60 repeat protein
MLRAPGRAEPEASMRPVHPHLDAPRRAPWPGPTRRALGTGLRWLAAAGLLAWQLVAAGPAQARAGDLDVSFGVGGKVTTDFTGTVDEANALVVQPDGKLVAAGWTLFVFGGWHDFALTRYNPDGSLDPTFSTDGKASTDFSVFDEANALVVQADGKLVAAGRAGFGFDFGLVRYNPDGTRDASFGTDGKITTDFGGFDQANALVVQADGKLVAAGSTVTFTGGGANTDFALARYNPDGSLDASFGSGGRVTTDFAGSTDQANALVMQGSKLVAAGLAVTGGGTNADFALARYKRNGALDRSFGSGGRVTTDFAGGADQANALVVQPGGKLVAAGSAVTGSSTDFALARYQAR